MTVIGSEASYMKEASKMLCFMLKIEKASIKVFLNAGGTVENTYSDLPDIRH